MQEPTEEIEESIQNEVLQSSEIVNVEVQDSILVIEGIDVNYTIAGGKIISVTPDLDAKSLIIKISTTNDGELVITLPKDVIDTDEQGFFILVDGEETAFLEELHDSSRTLTIPFYNGTEEIEIIGTFVIPEFGTIVVLALAISIVGIIAITAKSRLSLVPKL
jgi:predicted secreted protein with PEFG-CTERM motif